MSECPETLERIFRQLEEESERRAQEEQHRAEVLKRAAAEATLRKAKTRRRGSISISRLGQLTLDEFNSTGAQAPPTPKGLPIASNSPFYQSQIANASTSSVASGASAFSDDNHAHTEDPTQVFQIQQIAPKSSSISKILPRRLSRARSAAMMSPGDGVIDVAVQETTEHSSAPSEEGGSEAPTRRASVHASHNLRNQPSRTTISGPIPSTSWVARARGFTQKFRRKSTQDVPSHPMSPSPP